MPAVATAVALPVPVQTPSLNNQAGAEWALHAEIAYVFARHARHDMVNVQCSLELIDIVEKMRQMGSDVPLPPELQPEQVQIKVKQAIKQLASMANDLVLLNHAANRVAYRNTRVLTVRELLETAIGTRLGDRGVLPDAVMTGAAAEVRVLAMGDLLQAALAACCFQWTPWLAPLGEPVCDLRANDHSVELVFPTINADVVTSFANRCEALADGAGQALLQDALAAPTGELAFWLARFIIVLHGGVMTLVPTGPQSAGLAGTAGGGATAVHVVLPLAA